MNRSSLSLRRLATVGMLIWVCFGGRLGVASDATTLNDQAIEALERGDYAAAIIAFKGALELSPDDETIRANLAAAYNNYGVSRMGKDDFSHAVAAFRAGLKLVPDHVELMGNLARTYNRRAVDLIEAGRYTAAEHYLHEAIRYQPDEPTFRRNLSVAITYRGQALYDRRDRATAFHVLRQALEYDSNNASALMLLGQICYEQQQLSWALSYFKAAQTADPARFPELKERIAQLQNELEVERGFERLTHGVFDIRYDRELDGLDTETLCTRLSEAYDDIGHQLGYYPKHKVVVLVYSLEDFARLHSVPEWVAGVYDGKIRVPATSAAAEGREGEVFKRLIRHEYTHALVSDLSQGKCSTWLNEGLAKYMEYFDSSDGMPTPTLRRRFRKETLLPFATLEGDFIAIREHGDVLLAYEQSYSLVAYLIETYSIAKVKRMLTRYASGDTTEHILFSEFHRTPDRFESDWLEFVEEQFD